MTGDTVEDVPQAAPVADGVLHPLDVRWVRYRRRLALLRSMIYGALIIGAALAAALAMALPLTLPIICALLITLVIAGIGHMWPGIAYRYAHYRVDERGLEIRTGLLWQRMMHVPRSRIQHSDVSQGPVERRFGLATLTVFTAGTMHSAVRLPGLAHDRAIAIREHLARALDDDVV